MSKGLVDKTQEFEVAPFTVVIDSNEGAPFSFQGIKGRKRNGVQLPVVVKIVRKPMWNIGRADHGTGLADYSIEGLEELVQIERKSIEDLFGTLSSRRENFEREIDRLNRQCEAACVLIEGSFGHIASFKSHGPDPASVIGTMIAWGQRYPKVHWIPAGSRDMAERLAFRFLERFWIDREESIKSKLAMTQSVKTATEGSTGNGIIEKAATTNTMGRTKPANTGINRH